MTNPQFIPRRDIVEHLLCMKRRGAKGKPILLEGISTRFWNICGAIVRDKLQTQIMTSNWNNVATTTKDVLWAKLKERFTFPKGQEKFARNFVEGLLGRCFRNWRSTLNKEHVWKGKNARDDFGRIPPEIWEEFNQQKNMPEAKALSEENTAKAMKAAQNSHHLGVGGYAAKITIWRREEEERRRAGLPDMFEGLDERSRNWVLARILKVTPDDKVKFKHQTTNQIYESKLRKRDCYKKNLEEKMREIAKKEFVEFLANQNIATVADPTISDSQREAEPTMLLAHIGFVAPSSAGSLANMRYPINEIQVDTPCRLVAPSMAVTGHVFPKAPLPEYAWVQVVTVLDKSCEIDIPTDEGIEVLDDAMNQYILWHC
uniref:Uncharacterized protein n=1 Tax=Setaria viridis TaxID=4556 RepID=A0A4U6W384_SETVI|nr:hypothetical protein SEVIR_1G014700v2 [Setaria viridis]